MSDRENNIFLTALIVLFVVFETLLVKIAIDGDVMIPIFGTVELCALSVLVYLHWNSIHNNNKRLRESGC